MSEFKDEAFLKYVITAIVSNPDSIQITRKVDEMGVLLTLKVAQEDVSKVIGREGQIAKAIRLLLKAVGYTDKVRATLKIDAPQLSGRRENNREDTRTESKEN